MSMLSSQCDELREKAEELRVHGTFTGFGGLTSTDPLMLKSATLMRDAADTIWQLRDDLQRANAAVQDAEHDESMAWDRVRKAEAENDQLHQLRELVEDMLDCIEIRTAFGRPFTSEICESFAQRACELGIEVDGG